MSRPVHGEAGPDFWLQHAADVAHCSDHGPQGIRAYCNTCFKKCEQVRMISARSAIVAMAAAAIVAMAAGWGLAQAPIAIVGWGMAAAYAVAIVGSWWAYLTGRLS